MGRTRTLIVIGAGVGLVLAVAAGLDPWSTSPSELPPPNGSMPFGGAAAAPDPVRSSSPNDSSRSVADDRPASLVGTRPDGALVTDAMGAFVATPDAIDLFDYYLSAFGEEPLAQIVARIEREIRARLDPPDAALALLEKYLAYREEVRRLVETAGLDRLPLDRRLQRLRELRRSLFGAELAARLFEEEELRALDALEWRRVAADPDLTEEQRAEELAALEADWPEAERARIERVTLAQRVIARESAMREDGAAESEIQTQREQEFGAEAASRLAALDRARAEWTARVERYRAERARLEADPPVDEVEGAEALEALRARYFEGPELIRIRALDELEARRPTDS